MAAEYFDSGELFKRTSKTGDSMSDNVYKKIEIVGSSTTSIEDAIENAVSRAGQSVKNMGWFEVTETRGYIEDGKVKHFQVTLKIGFTLED